MAGLCQVGALPTLNSQQLKDDTPMLFLVAAGESEIRRHLATALSEVLQPRTGKGAQWVLADKLKT